MLCIDHTSKKQKITWSLPRGSSSSANITDPSVTKYLNLSTAVVWSVQLLGHELQCWSSVTSSNNEDTDSGPHSLGK